MSLATLLLLLLSAVPAAAPPQDPGAVPPSEAEQEPRTAADWNRRGIERLAADDPEGAVAAFRAARQLAPEDAVLALNLSRALAARGGQLLDLGRMPEALEAFRAGAAADRDGGHNELLQAHVLLRQGDRAAARELADGVVADFPANAAAARLAADLRAVAGDLDGAVALLAAALERFPDDAPLARRHRQLAEEREAQRGFLTDSSAHFDFRYDPRRPELVEAVPRLMADLEDAYLRVARDFGLAPTDRVLVLVLDRERYLAGAPEWSAGLYDGRIRLSVGDYAAERELLRGTMRHEFVHAALHRLGPPLPTWFQEGLAQLVEDRSVEAARRRLRAGSLPALPRLAGDWTSWEGREEVGAAYAYGLSLCRFLAEEYGPTAYPLLFERLRQRGFEEAFAATFGKPLALVDAEHRAALGDEAP